MNEKELRLECLRLAQNVGSNHEHERQTVERADAFYRFVCGSQTGGVGVALDARIMGGAGGTNKAA